MSFLHLATPLCTNSSNTKGLARVLKDIIEGNNINVRMATTIRCAERDDHFLLLEYFVVVLLVFVIREVNTLRSGKYYRLSLNSCVKNCCLLHHVRREINYPLYHFTDEWCLKRLFSSHSRKRFQFLKIFNNSTIQNEVEDFCQQLPTILSNFEKYYSYRYDGLCLVIIFRVNLMETGSY